MAANKAETRGKRSRRFGDRHLGAAHVRYERGSGHVVGEPFEDPDVLTNRSGQDDQIGRPPP